MGVVGLKPIETGVRAGSPRLVRSLRRLPSETLSDQERLAVAAQMFHVKRRRGVSTIAKAAGELAYSPRAAPRGADEKDTVLIAQKEGVSTDGSDRVPGAASDASSMRTVSANHTRRIAHQFGVFLHGDATAARSIPGASRQNSRKTSIQPTRSLFSFRDPVSPHLAARDAGVRIDLGAIERWIAEHEAPLTLVETAGALFSPIGYGVTNFDLARVVEADAVLLIAPDRLGVLHDLTTTLALAAAKGDADLGIVLSAPATKDTSTGRNAAEVERLGLGSVVAEFPRAACGESASQSAAEKVAAWVSQRPRWFR
jgi:dethiobiotin synthetase